MGKGDRLGNGRRNLSQATLSCGRDIGPGRRAEESATRQQNADSRYQSSKDLKQQTLGVFGKHQAQRVLADGMTGERGQTKEMEAGRERERGGLRWTRDH